jgi:hypothetical protein
VSQKIFVLCLILALYNIGTVLAAQDTQTDIGAISSQGTGIEIANSAVAGAKQRSTNPTGLTGESRQPLLLAAAEKNRSSAKSAKSNTDQPETDSFRELDIEAEKLLRQVLDLSSDIEIIDEQHTYPPKNQLLVLVTLQPSKFFELDYVELEVDGQVVAAHPYTEKDIAAMVRGGGHRLYLANLPAGTHELKAKFTGKVPRDPDYQREASFKFISGVDRTLIELYINSVENNSFPQFTIKEWN